MAFTAEQKKEWRQRPEVKARHNSYKREWAKRNPERMEEYSRRGQERYARKAAANKAAGLTVDGKIPKKRGPKAGGGQTETQIREKAKQRGRVRSRRNREKAIENLGGQCERCGYNDTNYPGIYAFQIDHVDPVGNAKRRKANQRGIDWAAQGHTEGLQLLCANCHMIKTYGNGDHMATSDEGEKASDCEQYALRFAKDEPKQ